MAIIYEKIDGRSFTVDANGSAAGTRTFIVLQATSEGAARVAFESDDANLKFPSDDPGTPGSPGTRLPMTFDRIDISPEGNGTHYVVKATYSTFKGGRRQNTEAESNAEPFFGWDRAKAEVKIPWCWAERITTSASEDGNQEAIVWKAGVRDIVERRVRRKLTVSYRTQNTATLDVIAEEEDKLHFIRGRYYQFLGADVSQDSGDPLNFRITYSWEWDKGTFVRQDSKTTLIEDTDNDPTTGWIAELDGKAYVPIPEGTIIEAGGALVRPPYCVLDLIAQYDPTVSPKCIAWSPYEESPNGWRRLPGMIPL